jgi:hypothetical protein
MSGIELDHIGRAVARMADVPAFASPRALGLPPAPHPGPGTVFRREIA